MSKSFVVRMVCWSALALYLICDFFIFTGPIKQELRRLNPTEAEKMSKIIAEGICAKVYNEPVYLTQVDRRVHEKLWRTGRDPQTVNFNEIKLLRWVAMDEIVDENILRIKSRVNAKEVTVTDAEIDAEVARFEKRFPSPEVLDQALADQGIESRKELRFRMAARIQQEKYALTKITPAITTSEKDARQWYDDHQKEISMPERRRVRHVFLATLDHPSEQAKANLTKHLQLLQAGKIKFSSLASTVSEDERSKTKGGDLGWTRVARLPGDFASAVFALPTKHPTLIRTKLGWHIVEVTEIKPPELLPFEEMKEEITAAITDSRRADAIQQYRHQLRVINRLHIEIFPETLKQDDGWKIKHTYSKKSPEAPEKSD